MKSSVIIKGNKYGFQIVLNPTLPFEELLREVGNKFKESTHFFDLNKPIAVSFTGRELTSGEQNLLVDTISENSGLNISCVIDGAKVYETQFAKVLNEIREEEKKENLINTFNALLEMGVIPIVNENDSVSYKEIESEDRLFGDNDMLSCRCSTLPRKASGHFLRH